MLDFACFLAGAVRMLAAPLLLLLWHRKTGARLFPALIAFGACFPVFFLGNAVRSGISQENLIAYSLERGLLYGILEEGTKFLVLRFYLTEYDSRRDGVTYGIGHSAFEDFFAGLSCFGLIGTGSAAPDIFWVNLWTAVTGTLSTAAVTVLIFYGIHAGKPKRMLAAAVIYHTLSNACAGLFYFSEAFMLAELPVTAGLCYAAYRCWKALWNPYEDPLTG